MTDLTRFTGTVSNPRPTADGLKATLVHPEASMVLTIPTDLAGREVVYTGSRLTVTVDINDEPLYAVTVEDAR